MEAIYGPLGALVAVVFAILAAVKRPPLWHTPADYLAMRDRAERAEARADRMERLLHEVTGIAQKQLQITERAVLPPGEVSR
jgi:hypothetical protein